MSDGIKEQVVTSLRSLLAKRVGIAGEDAQRYIDFTENESDGRVSLQYEAGAMKEANEHVLSLFGEIKGANPHRIDVSLGNISAASWYELGAALNRVRPDTVKTRQIP